MKLSICCLTYNHGAYLEEAIRSFVMQQTDFEFEIVIADDASTDGTFALVSDYCQRYPNIRYHRHEKNIGMMANAIFTLEQCTGDYIALCEGDDYWTDPYKLQKQVAFLEANPEYAICLTGYVVKNELAQTEKTVLPPAITSIEELLEDNKFTTATAVFDARYFRPTPDWFAHLPGGDWALYLTVLYRSKKKAFCLEDVTTVYRMHAGGIHGSMYTSNEKIITTLKWAIACYRTFQTRLFDGEYDAVIEAAIKRREAMIADLSDERKNRPAVLQEITTRVPANGTFILIDDESLEVKGAVEGRTVLPFTEQNGVFWGLPLDDEAAIAEIKRQDQKGVHLIVFTWIAFWWLDYYAGMYAYLNENYECVLNNERLIGFSLQKKKAPLQAALKAEAL